MQPVLLDTSVYVSAFRRGETAILSIRRYETDSPLWLSAVVLEELYAGADNDGRHLIEQAQYNFDKIGRILVPSFSDWTETGRTLERLGAKYGYEQIGRSRLTNAALIAISAGRKGITVVTADERDFGRLAEFRPFQWQIADVS